MSHMLQAITVFYADRMVAEANSFSPSAGKPRHVLAAWKADQLPIAIQPVLPVDEHDLALCHDPAYVRGVLTCMLPNGFGNQSTDVARSLPWTSGALLSAARHALREGIACAPVSGFHHACYDSGGGYCTFNGLMVTVAKLLSEGLVHRVLVLDCDQHYGNGTDQLIAQLSMDGVVENATFGRWFSVPADASAYLSRLGQTVRQFGDFDLVLYQAGADVHVDDPLGGVLTTEQMIERDRTVFQAARDSSVPIAWNLAGGYQTPLAAVVALHVNTMRECVRVYLDLTAVGPRC